MSYLLWFLFSFQARSWFLSLGFTLCLGSVLPRVLYAYRVVSWRPETIRKVCVPVLTISWLHLGLGRFSIEQHYGNVSITRLRRKLGNNSSPPNNPIMQFDTTPTQQFRFELQKSRVAFVLISFLPSFIFIVLPHYLGFCSLLLSFIRRMFCVFTESFSLHLGSMGVDAYDGLFYIYW